MQGRVHFLAIYETIEIVYLRIVHAVFLYRDKNQ